MAEREGFEPPIPFQVWPLSRRLVSTTHAPLRAVYVVSSLFYQDKAAAAAPPGRSRTIISRSTFISEHTHLRAHPFQSTPISEHTHFRAHPFQSTPISEHTYLRAHLCTCTWNCVHILLAIRSSSSGFTPAPVFRRLPRSDGPRHSRRLFCACSSMRRRTGTPRPTPMPAIK